MHTLHKGEGAHKEIIQWKSSLVVMDRMYMLTEAIRGFQFQGNHACLQMLSLFILDKKLKSILNWVF